MREPELQIRMRAQIADLADVSGRGGVASHDQCVGVVETELVGNSDARFGEFRAQRVGRNDARVL